MAFSITKLVSLAAELEIDFGVGPCLGFDAILAMAYLSDQQDAWDSLLDRIGRYETMTSLAAQINEARLRVGLGKGKDGDKKLLSIYNFLVSIAKINSLQFQVFHCSFAYQEYHREKLLFTHHTQEKGGLRSQEETLVMQKREAERLFSNLQQFAKDYPQLCFCIESHDHDVFLCYNVSTGFWQLTDINDFEEETNDYYMEYTREEIAEAVLACFNDEETSLMRIKLIGPSATFTTTVLSRFKCCLGNLGDMDEQRAQMINADGVGLLYMEAFYGNLDKVKHLLALGANPGQTSVSKGLDPAYVACENGHIDIVKALLSTGQRDINQQSKNGTTLLLLACYNKHWHIVHYLLAYEGINVNLANKDGLTALHLLIINEQTELCQSLLELGADRNAQALEMGTPLEVVGVINNQQITALLTGQESIRDRNLSDTPGASIASNVGGDLFPTIKTDRNSQPLMGMA